MIETITLRATKDLKEKLRMEAKKQGFTVNALVLQILWEWANSLKGDESNGTNKRGAGKRGKTRK